MKRNGALIMNTNHSLRSDGAITQPQELVDWIQGIVQGKAPLPKPNEKYHYVEARLTLRENGQIGVWISFCPLCGGSHGHGCGEGYRVEHCRTQYPEYRGHSYIPTHSLDHAAVFSDIEARDSSHAQQTMAWLRSVGHATSDLTEDDIRPGEL
jgi:hypothetical protein